MTILLGKYGELARPFYLYSYKSDQYMCLEDIDFIYLNQQLNTKVKSIQEIYKTRSKEFIKEISTGRLFVTTRTLILIARLFNCYSLAELCKLNQLEILGNVAEPLFDLIQCNTWYATPCTMERINIQCESLYGNEWDHLIAKSTKEKELYLEIQLPKHNDTFYRWLSCNIYQVNSSPDTLQSLINSTITKKQQYAIIETRLRKLTFKSQQRDYKKKQNIAGNLLSNKLPPSPPPFQSRKRKIYLLDDSTHKRQKSHLMCEHGTDNLTLLATQATQLPSLPLSPDVSPLPTPLVLDTNTRLPSLQTMLSGLYK